MIVVLTEGRVRGKQFISVRDKVPYWSFQGIPYAKPPIGSLRFKAPEPVEPWPHVLDASTEGNSSWGLDIFTRTVVGRCSEDCLFINVYTTEVPNKPEGPEEIFLKPVMVWIHGGAFCMGSGGTDMFGPDYLVTEQVVLVTFNYRLGALGFLGLNTVDYPGNTGMKDMVMALKWVQKNISAFGGDPNNVTIFGESAGGAAVQLLMLSKLTSGLFHKAISQSGTAFSPWAFTTKSRDFAFGLGKLLGCPTEDENELLEFLKEVEPERLVAAEFRVRPLVDPTSKGLYLAFLPCIEPDSEGAFLTRHPHDLMRDGEVNDVPYILGVNTLEGTVNIPVKGIPKDPTDEDINILVPQDLQLPIDSAIRRTLLAKIKNFYFPDGFEEKQFVKALSAIHFLHGVVKTTDLLLSLKERRSSTYVYQFSFDGDKRIFKDLAGFHNWRGTAHGDELGYLFHVNKVQPQLVKGTREWETVKKMTAMWANFARYGDPTPQSGLWEPQSTEERVFLDIDDGLTLQRDLAEKEMRFWKEVYLTQFEQNK